MLVDMTLSDSTQPADLHTARLILKNPSEADIASLFAIYGDPRTNTFNPAGPYPNIEKAQMVMADWLEHWHKHGFGGWTICIPSVMAGQVDKVIGFGGISYMNYGDEQRANLGYRFAVEAWGKGYATEFGAFALAHAFQVWHLPEVYGLVRPNHHASIRVLEKIGMTLSGELDDVVGEAASLVYKVVSQAS